jgi:hypothetical protein
MLWIPAFASKTGIAGVGKADIADVSVLEYSDSVRLTRS